MNNGYLESKDVNKMGESYRWKEEERKKGKNILNMPAIIAKSYS